MNQPSQPVTGLQRSTALGRAPAVVVLAAVALGIVADRYLSIPWWMWLTAGWLALLGFWGMRRRTHNVWATLLLLLACCLTAGGMHHLRRGVVPANDLRLYAAGKPRPIHLRGVLLDEPLLLEEVRKPGRWERKPRGAALPEAAQTRQRTLCRLGVRTIVLSDREIEVSGNARLEIEGLATDLHAQDEVELWGRLSRPTSARNPNGFDFREYLNHQGLHSFIRCQFPECVVVRGHSPWGWPQQGMRLAQDRAEQVLTTYLPDSEQGLATALLLGPRKGLSPELREAFAESGCAHLLAISGINIGILVSFLLFWGRCWGLSPGKMTVGMILCVLGYVLLTDGNPPLVRAALLVVIGGVGQLLLRPGHPFNGLACACLVLLLWNPSDLFEIGPQLSFLAVVGLIWIDREWRAWRRRIPVDPLADLRPWWQRGLRTSGLVVLQAYVYTAGVWLFTQPLVTDRFHLLPHFGFVVNVLLIPWMTLLLWLGYGLLILGLLAVGPLQIVAAPVLSFLGWSLGWGLKGLVQVVTWTAEMPAGHLYVPPPPLWWLIGFYLLLAGLVLYPWRTQQRRWTWRATGIWLVIGLGAQLLPASNAGLRCTFLAVGHGGAILLELPNGKKLLYDAGSLGEPERAAGIVQEAVLRTGTNRLDGIVLSHADADHYNGTPGVLDNLHVGEILAARSFLKWEVPAIRELAESAFRKGVPLRLIGAGDELSLTPEVKLRCLHPAWDWKSNWDNANSILLEVEYAGKRILLTGDLEREGLGALLRLPRRKVDVLLAPHHGGRRPNTPELAAWSTPDVVVVSGGEERFVSVLDEIYPDSRIFWTVENGAVSVRISPRGELTAQPFVE
ncbi:MAG: ComEC/Rec2 family competence protein [Planctomycetales bacterium]